MKNYDNKRHSKLGEHNLIPTSSNGFIPTPTKNGFINKTRNIMRLYSSAVQCSYCEILIEKNPTISRVIDMPVY